MGADHQVLITDSHVTGPVYVPVWMKKGTLSFPKSQDTPVIMVGPGTGVAPFRGFIEERAHTGAGSRWLCNLYVSVSVVTVNQVSLVVD